MAERYNFGKEFPGSNCIYHAVKGMIFRESNLSFKIDVIFNDNNESNLPILNQERLKRILFKKIKQIYNNRINRYKLTAPHFSDSDIGDLDIKKYSFQNKRSDRTDEGAPIYGGKYSLYPRGFRCDICGDYRIIDDMNLLKIQNGKCLIPRCGGHYVHIAMVKYCEQCGKLDEIYYETPSQENKKSSTLKLVWDRWDLPRTWRFKTSDGVTNDFLKIPCTHKFQSISLCTAPPKKYNPMPITSGGVVKPVVLSTVDIPDTYIKHPMLEQLICAIISGKLSEIELELAKENQDRNKKISVLEFIDDLYKQYKNETNRKAFRKILSQNNPQMSEEEFDLEMKKSFKIDQIEYVINSISQSVDVTSINYEEISNFFALNGLLNQSNEITSLSHKILSGRSVYSMGEYQKIKKEYKIKEISYVSKLNLIASCIGTITGPIFSTQEDFIPHFSPIWSNLKEKKKFEVYSFPYQTEGMLFEFDKQKIVLWLENEIKEKFTISPEEFLLSLKEDSKEYQKIYTLLHTISHTLIKKSAVFTGIDTDSCNEIIFVSAGAILIHSTANINIGGFGALFENNVLQYFTEANLEANNCIYDPLCLEANGACFSCLYLPEFVCSNFNKELDRDILIGKKRFKSNFWG